MAGLGSIHEAVSRVVAVLAVPGWPVISSTGWVTLGHSEAIRQATYSAHSCWPPMLISALAASIEPEPGGAGRGSSAVSAGREHTTAGRATTRPPPIENSTALP